MTSTLTTLTDYCLTIIHQKKFNSVSYFFVVVVVLVVVVVVVNYLLSFVSFSSSFFFFWCSTLISLNSDCFYYIFSTQT